ncbi:MAG: 50S ribosomal protein L1 [Candidatus Altiarchaeales archaeon]|nr:50S ribosomal protein L1 [Candidatus Altiarchaeales archaeon]
MEKNSLKEKVAEALQNQSERKFKQTVELVFNFRGLDMEQPENKLNLNVFLPKGRGRDVEIGVFADGDMNLRAKKVSKHVLNKQELEQYAKSKRRMRVLAGQCYGFIAQPDLMVVIGKNWGVVLAPRGKMPQPVPPNVELEPVIKRIKNSVRVKSKKLPTVQMPIGTADMNPEDLAENGMTIYDNITKKIAKESISSIYVKTTMGKPIRVV